VQDDKKLPFIFEVTNNQNIIIKNAEEEIVVKDVKQSGRDIIINFPVYDAKIVAQLTTDNTLKGTYSKAPKFREVEFTANYGLKDRFYSDNAKTFVNVRGRWKVNFGKSKDERYFAVGEFKQDGNDVTGTFITETGDYRYLEGILYYDKGLKTNMLKLSTFDGAHAFLFDAKVTNNRMIAGNFYSGNHYKDAWNGIRNGSFELRDPNSLTFIKPKSEAINFKFKNLDGKIVSLNDKRYKNKPVIIQIMGSWCPNCLDESRFLSQYYKKNKDVEIIALAFENAVTDRKAIQNLNRLKNEVGINYEILLATSNLRDKAHAAEKLPFLNKVISYPTLIFMDKNAEVKNIHTGFNGPATGEYYENFKQDFSRWVKEIKL